MIGSGADAELLLNKTIGEAEHMIEYGTDVLIMTSRKLVVGNDALLSLKIGSVVAAALVEVLRGVNIRPRYIIAKVRLRNLQRIRTFTNRNAYSCRGKCLHDLGGYYVFRCRDSRIGHEACYGDRASSTRCTSMEM